MPIDTLRDDRYTFRENTHEIAGERTGRRFRAGDPVHVVLDRILAQERRLQFSILEEGIPLTGKRAPKPSAKSERRTRAKTMRTPAGKRQEEIRPKRQAALEQRTRPRRR